jgi:MFS family permease
MILAPMFAIIGGWALDRYGPKVVVVNMGIVTGISLFLTSHVNQMWQLYLTYSLLLAIGTGATYTIVMSTGSRWFIRYRATALAIIGTGAGLGTLIFAPFAAQLIDVYNWRVSLLALAVIAWALVIPVSLFLKKEPGEGPPVYNDDGKDSGLVMKSGNSSIARGFSLTETVRIPNYWLLFFIWFAYSFCVHLVITHVVPRAQDTGISPMQSATIVSVVGAVTIPSRLLIGRLSDKVGRKGPGILCAILQAVSLLWLMASNKIWMFYLFAVLYGIGYGGIDPPIVAIIGDLFGLCRLGTIMGSLILGWGLGAALGPYLTGLVFDLTDNYSLAFLLGAVIIAVAATFIYRIKVPIQKP